MDNILKHNLSKEKNNHNTVKIGLSYMVIILYGTSKSSDFEGEASDVCIGVLVLR